jgi:hypothetical protein
VSHFFRDTIVKLPSHLAKSCHGVYYFRISYRVGFALKEKRISLQTKNPQEARAKAVHLSGDPQKVQAHAARCNSASG